MIIRRAESTHGRPQLFCSVFFSSSPPRPRSQGIENSYFLCMSSAFNSVLEGCVVRGTFVLHVLFSGSRLCAHHVMMFACCSSKLTAELDAIPAEMEALDGEIARAEHLAAERLLDRLRTDVEVGYIGVRCDSNAPPPPRANDPAKATPGCTY